MEKQERGQQQDRKDPRNQINVAKDTTTEEAKRGHTAYMEQMMEYQYEED